MYATTLLFLVLLYCQVVTYVSLRLLFCLTSWKTPEDWTPENLALVHKTGLTPILSQVVLCQSLVDYGKALYTRFKTPPHA